MCTSNLPSLRKTFTFLMAFFCLLSPAIGQDEVDYSEMSLEDLLNVEVTVSSTKAETIIETPAIVSRFNREDLERMGIRTLKDMLSFFPGFVSLEAGIGTSPIMIRGIVDAFNQKVLFLIDGVPYYQSSHSIIGLSGVPFESISHVEVIRGPGAVIYGTNASGGVINVVTRKNDGKPSSAGLAAGSNSLFNGSLYYRNDFSEDSYLYLTAEIQSEDGYEARYNNTPSPPFFNPQPATGGTIEKAEEFNSFMLRYTNKKFNAVAQWFDSERDGLAGVGTIENTSVLKDEGYLLHMDYGWEFDAVNVNVYSDYNAFVLELPLERALNGFTDPGGFRFSNGGDDNYRWRSGLNFNLIFNDNVTFLSGWEYEVRSTGDYQQFDQATGATVATLMDGESIHEVSLFGQVDMTFDKWRLLLGARYTDNEKAGDDITPRLSIVYTIDETQSIKILYSTGFNSPNFLQQGIFLQNVIVGDPNLVAETVTTLDVAYSYSANNTLFVANIYYTEAENFIGRGPRPGELGNFYFNTESFDRTGLELDFQKVFGPSRVFANLAYQDEGNEVIADDVTALFSPQLTAVVGYSRRLQDHHSLGGSLRHLGERGVADAQTLVNVNYQYQAERFTAYLTGLNILDEERVNPDVQDFVPNREIPGGDGLGFRGGVKFYF